MATVACRACGGRVGDQATSCPHCGQSNPGAKMANFARTLAFTGVGLFFLIAIGILFALA